MPIAFPRRALRTTCIVVAVIAAPVVQAQVLTLKGTGGQVKTLDSQALAALPHQSVSASEHGHTTVYSGVPVSALTSLVDAPHGEAVKGAVMATVLIVTAADGYRVVLGLAETDPSIRANAVIVADSGDGRPLDAREGPFRLVVEGDKRPARSARNIQSIEVRTLP